ncbi:MAG: ABC transporter permease [Candidatus Woesearchaeota archaeon]
MKFFKTISKNLKLLLRSKGNAVMILLGPLLIILLVGLAFNNTRSYDLAIGTYSSGYNDLTMKYVSALENSSYQVIKFTDLPACINRVKDGTIHTCIAFPDNFVIENEKDLEIKFYVDYSRLNLVHMVIGTLSSGVAQESTELTVQYATILLQKIDSAKSSIDTIIKDVISLEESSSANIEDADALISEAESLDLETGEIDMSGIVSEAESLYSDTEEIQASGEDAVDRGFLLIKELQGKTINATSILNDFKNDMEDINESIDGLTNLTSLEFDTLISTIENASSAVSDLKTKLDAAKTSKTNIISGLNTLKENLDTLGKDIETIKTKLEVIVDDLNDISITNAERIAKPVNSKIEPVIAENTRLSYLFPSFLILVIMFIGILLSSTLVITEKNSKAFFRINTTPTHDSTFIFATFATSLLVLLVQSLLILACAFYFLKTPIFDNYQITLAVLSLSIAFFSLLGMLIGYVFSTQEATAMISISISSVFFFLSNLVLPLESMSEFVQKIAHFNPYVVLSDLARKSFLFKGGLEEMYASLLIIFGVCILLLAFVYAAQKVSKMKYFNRIPHIKKRIVQNAEDTGAVIGNHELANEADLLKLAESLTDNQFYGFMEKYKQELTTWAVTRLNDRKLAKKLKKSRDGLIEYLEKKAKKVKNSKK